MPEECPEGVTQVFELEDHGPVALLLNDRAGGELPQTVVELSKVARSVFQSCVQVAHLASVRRTRHRARNHDLAQVTLAQRIAAPCAQCRYRRLRQCFGFEEPIQFVQCFDDVPQSRLIGLLVMPLADVSRKRLNSLRVNGSGKC